MILNKLIGSEDGGKEIKTVLKHKMGLSKRMITRLKLVDGICVNGTPVFTNYICREGDLVTANIDLVESPQEIPVEYGELTVLYEDDFLLAVYKPEGMLTHPSRSQLTDTLMGYVLGYLSDSGGTTCHALNRLDRYTSGIVLFAKNAYTKSLFSQPLASAKKTYLAVTHGRVIGNSGTINLPILRLQSGNIRRGVSSDGAKSITHYQLLDLVQYSGCNFSILKLEPETGRTHQLRVHCSALGHPIVGDQIYNNEESKDISDRLNIHGQLLHAERLQFFHPIDNKNIDIHCPIIREPMKSFLDLRKM